MVNTYKKIDLTQKTNVEKSLSNAAVDFPIRLRFDQTQKRFARFRTKHKFWRNSDFEKEKKIKYGQKKHCRINDRRWSVGMNRFWWKLPL